jgi:hypothetical protein
MNNLFYLYKKYRIWKVRGIFVMDVMSIFMTHDLVLLYTGVVRVGRV